MPVSLPEAANAQSASCDQLNTTLNTLSGNRDFQTLQANQTKARDLAAQIQNAESVFVRGGCQDTLNKGQKLNAECMRIARVIVNGRQDYDKLSASIETGQAVAQQREVALQQIARFGCNARSSARFNVETEVKSPFARLFEQLFGGSQQVIDPYGGYNVNGSTLRTVCVRSCDGYYWPISFSTVPEISRRRFRRLPEPMPRFGRGALLLSQPRRDAGGDDQPRRRALFNDGKRLPLPRGIRFKLYLQGADHLRQDRGGEL